MQRRSFLKGAAFAAGMAATADGSESPGHINPCLNDVTTLDAPFERECEAYVAAGFKHIELWFAKLRNQSMRPPEVEGVLRRHGLTPVSACASAGDLLAQHETPARHSFDLEQNLEMAQALGILRYVVFCDTG